MNSTLIDTRIAPYRTLFGCPICQIAWVSPVVETTLEELFEMNSAVFCPHCSANAHHENPYLRTAPEILKIQEVGNDYTLIAQI